MSVIRVSDGAPRGAAPSPRGLGRAAISSRIVRLPAVARVVEQRVDGPSHVGVGGGRVEGVPAPSRMTRSALWVWSAPSGSSKVGSPWGEGADDAPEPPWEITRSQAGSSSAWSTYRSTRMCSGWGPISAGSTSRPSGGDDLTGEVVESGEHALDEVAGSAVERRAEGEVGPAGRRAAGREGPRMDGDGTRRLRPAAARRDGGSRVGRGRAPGRRRASRARGRRPARAGPAPRRGARPPGHAASACRPRAPAPPHRGRRRPRRRRQTEVGLVADDTSGRQSRTTSSTAAACRRQPRLAKFSTNSSSPSSRWTGGSGREVAGGPGYARRGRPRWSEGLEAGGPDGAGRPAPTRPRRRRGRPRRRPGRRGGGAAGGRPADEREEDPHGTHDRAPLSISDCQQRPPGRAGCAHGRPDPHRRRGDVAGAPPGRRTADGRAVPGPGVRRVDDRAGAVRRGGRQGVRAAGAAGRLGGRVRVGLRGRARGPVRRHGLAARRRTGPGRDRLRVAPGRARHRRLVRALRLLVGWGFEELGLETIVWQAFTGNWAAARWRGGSGSGRGHPAAVPPPARRRGGTRGSAPCCRDDPRAPATTWLDVPVLEGDGFRLRPVREDDAPRIHEGTAEATTRALAGHKPAPYTLADARATSSAAASSPPPASASPGRSPTPTTTGCSARCSGSTGCRGRVRDRLLHPPDGAAGPGHESRRLVTDHVSRRSGSSGSPSRRGRQHRLARGRDGLGFVSTASSGSAPTSATAGSTWRSTT